MGGQGSACIDLLLLKELEPEFFGSAGDLSFLWM